MALEKFQHGKTDYPNRHVSWWNNQKREQLSREMLEEAQRLDLQAIIQMISVVGSWDKQMKSLQEQGYMTGDNTTYREDMT